MCVWVYEPLPVTDMDDRELLARWAAGEQGPGRALFERHFTTVRRFFQNKVEADIDDLIQQTFLACIESRNRFRGDSSFKTYLLGIARHQLLAYYRRRARRVELDFEQWSVADLATSPSGIVSRQQAQQALLIALQSIPLDLQIALELSYWEQLTAPEIATVLEVPVNTVYTKLWRARDLLRKALLAEPADLARLQVLEDLEAWSIRIRAIHTAGQDG
jgi:RNA polymerase sigma factor (sigma-70 family)